MTRYQVPREETSINLTNISEPVYFYQTATCAKNLQCNHEGFPLRLLDLFSLRHGLTVLPVLAEPL